MIETKARLLTVEQAAEFLGFSRRRLYELIRQDLLPSVKVGRQVWVDREALEQWISGGGKSLPGGWRWNA